MNETQIQTQTEVVKSPAVEVVPKQTKPVAELPAADIVPTEVTTHLERVLASSDGERVFQEETGENSKKSDQSKTSESQRVSLQDQYNALVARALKTGRDVELDLEYVKYRTKDEKLIEVDPAHLSEESLLAIKNYVLSLEMASVKPETATVESLIKGLTGFKSYQRTEIINYLAQTHLLIHDMYGLPSEELLQPGHMQEYVNQLEEIMKNRGIKLNIGKTIGGSAGEFSEEKSEPFFTIGKSGRTQNSHKGKITIDPEKIDITDGSHIIPLETHELIHGLQYTNPIGVDPSERLVNLAVMEFDAYVGSNVFDSDTNWEFIQKVFEHILKSFKNGRCDFPTDNFATIPNGPRTLKR